MFASFPVLVLLSKEVVFRMSGLPKLSKQKSLPIPATFAVKFLTLLLAFIVRQVTRPLPDTVVERYLVRHGQIVIAVIAVEADHGRPGSSCLGDVNNGFKGRVERLAVGVWPWGVGNDLIGFPS